MRARFVIANFVVAAAVAIAGKAGAADYGADGYATGGVRAPQMLVYDNQPGVYVRAYWTQPWQGRHYYPFTGKKPKVGRHERLSDVRPAPPPAESYYREWSTLSLFPPPPPRQVRVIEQLPDDQTLGPQK
jgi:hypothetical protein